MQEHWYGKIETQIGITGSAVGLYSFTLNEIIGILTVILLVGQIGLLLPRYWAWGKEKYKRWFGKGK